jgi:hypothetical protein
VNSIVIKVFWNFNVDNARLESYLNIINNQLNTRRSHKDETIETTGLHEQFVSLSKAYDSSQ